MKLIVLASRFPWPLDKGDKLRIYHQVKRLSEFHDVYLLALSERKISDTDKKELLKYCKEVHVFSLTKLSVLTGMIKAFFSSLPLQVGYFYSKNISKKINELVVSIKPDLIYGQLVRVAEYIKETDVPKCLDFQDAFSAGLKRRFEKSNILIRWIFRLEYKRVHEYEAQMKHFFNILTIITDTDLRLLPKSVQDKVEIIPNGVDFEHFETNSKARIEKKYDLVFTGNMNYPPNIKAALFLIKEIMPIVWKKYPNSKVLIAGSSPSIKVKSLGSELVDVSGWVDDIRTAYRSAKVFVAPMQIGTGLQNKLLEAMAIGLPCVTSDLANKALKAKPKEQILIAPKDSASIFADNIISLLQDDGFANNIGINGNIFVKQNYDWYNSVEKLSRLFVDFQVIN